MTSSLDCANECSIGYWRAGNIRPGGVDLHGGGRRSDQPKVADVPREMDEPGKP